MNKYLSELSWCSNCLSMSTRPRITFPIPMEEEKDILEKIYQKLNEEEDSVFKKWNESLIPKTILLFPIVAFVMTFLKVNTDKTILDLLTFLVLGGLLVLGGIFLNYLLSRGK